MQVQPKDGDAEFDAKRPQAERPTTGQRRQATVLFADMASFTPTAERLGEEQTFLLVRRVLGAMTEAVRAHDGMVSELLGDGILAIFGAPIAQESAPVEACKAAGEITERLLALEDRTRSRIWSSSESSDRNPHRTRRSKQQFAGYR